MPEFTTIAISRDTHKRLCVLGKKGDSFNAILTRLLDAQSREVEIPA